MAHNSPSISIDDGLEEPGRGDVVEVRRRPAPRAQKGHGPAAGELGLVVQIPARGQHRHLTVLFESRADVDAKVGRDLHDRRLRPVARHEVQAAALGEVHLQRLGRALQTQSEGAEVHGHAVLQDDVVALRQPEVVRRERAPRHRVAHARPRVVPPLVLLRELEAHLARERLLRPREGDEAAVWVDVRVGGVRGRHANFLIQRAAVERDAAQRPGAREVHGFAQGLQRVRVDVVGRAGLPQC